MSIVTTPTKSRVSKPSGIKLRPEDGLIIPHAEKGVTRVPFYMEAHNTDHLATERCAEKSEKLAVHYERVLTVDHPDGTLVRVESKQKKSVGAAPKQSKQSKFKNRTGSVPAGPKATSLRNGQLDAMIRKEFGQHVKITPMVRKAYRDAIAFRYQVKEMSAA
jgi:hypothetical protein